MTVNLFDDWVVFLAERAKALLLCTALALGATGATANIRLDDSASPRAVVRAPLVLSEYGQPLSQLMRGSPTPQRAILEFGRIEYRLATAPFLGRHARIYFVIPPLIPGLRSPQGLQVSWRSEGRFASGSGRPGDKVLVWSGVVQEAMMNEALSMRQEYLLRELLPQAANGVSFECFFEIDVGP